MMGARALHLVAALTYTLAAGLLTRLTPALPPPTTLPLQPPPLTRCKWLGVLAAVVPMGYAACQLLYLRIEEDHELGDVMFGAARHAQYLLMIGVTALLHYAPSSASQHLPTTLLLAGSVGFAVVLGTRMYPIPHMWMIAVLETVGWTTSMVIEMLLLRHAPRSDRQLSMWSVVLTIRRATVAVMLAALLLDHTTTVWTVVATGAVLPLSAIMYAWSHPSSAPCIPDRVDVVSII
jgi:hypothetical protein